MFAGFFVPAQGLRPLGHSLCHPSVLSACSVHRGPENVARGISKPRGSSSVLCGVSKFIPQSKDRLMGLC